MYIAPLLISLPSGNAMLSAAQIAKRCVCVRLSWWEPERESKRANRRAQLSWQTSGRMLSVCVCVCVLAYVCKAHRETFTVLALALSHSRRAQTSYCVQVYVWLRRFQVSTAWKETDCNNNNNNVWHLWRCSAFVRHLLCVCLCMCVMAVSQQAAAVWVLLLLRQYRNFLWHVWLHALSSQSVVVVVTVVVVVVGSPAFLAFDFV